jgi:hypothetical protein
MTKDGCSYVSRVKRKIYFLIFFFFSRHQAGKFGTGSANFGEGEASVKQ